MPYVSATVGSMIADTPKLPAVRGWCPSAHAPMEAGDGWIVRARVGCRPVAAVQWSEVADLAETVGNGLVEFTMRGNLQVRGVAEHLTGDAAERLVTVGLAGSNESDDRRRLLVVNPLARLAPVGGDATTPEVTTPAETTARVEELFAVRGGELPAKWWAVVDADTAWPMPVDACDMALQQHPEGWRVLLAGREVWSGRDPRQTASHVIERCAALRRRARDLDPDDVHEAAAVDVAAVEAATTVTGLPSPAPFRSPRASWWGVRRLGGWVAAAASPPFGVAPAVALRALASVAATPDVTVHPTPARGVVLVAPERRSADLARCLNDLDRLGWITSDHDPRRLVSACIGTRGCAASLIDTWQMATELVGSTSTPERVHVSGCSKRCGAPTGVRELVASVAGIETVVPQRSDR